MVGVLNASAQNNSASDTADTQPPADPAVTDSAGAIVTEPRPTVVIEVHRTVYVDEHASSGQIMPALAPHLFPDSYRIMGWDVAEEGFRLVLSPKLPEVVRTELRPLVDSFLLSRDLTRRDLQAAAKENGRPWDMAKGFDASAPCSPLRPCAMRESGTCAITAPPRGGPRPTSRPARASTRTPRAPASR